jgi:predicted nucleic acid-binding protein
LIFLDTNALSEIMRPKPNAIVVGWLVDNDIDLALSAVVVGEISVGTKRIRKEERSKRLANTLLSLRERYLNRIYPYDEASAIVYGDILGAASRTGRNLHSSDGIIAAIAIRHGAALATRNVKDFEFLKLKVVNAWA